MFWILSKIVKYGKFTFCQIFFLFRYTLPYIPFDCFSGRHNLKTYLDKSSLFLYLYIYTCIENFMKVTFLAMYFCLVYVVKIIHGLHTITVYSIILRFWTIGSCISHQAAQSKLLELGSEFDKKVLQWNEINLIEEENFKNELVQQLLLPGPLPNCIEGAFLNQNF